MLNKLQQKVSKLQSSLDLQVHVQSELENELTEKNKEIDARGNGQNACGCSLSIYSDKDSFYLYSKYGGVTTTLTNVVWATL